MEQKQNVLWELIYFISNYNNIIISVKQQQLEQRLQQQHQTFNVEHQTFKIFRGTEGLWIHA